MTKFYISGRISERPMEEAVTEFTQMEDMLKDWRVEMKAEHWDSINGSYSTITTEKPIVVNPLKNGLPIDAPWEEHMAVDILTLMECDAIFMMLGWCESRGATLEHAIAQRMGKEIYYQKDKSHEENH